MDTTERAPLTTRQRLILTAILTALVGLPVLLFWSVLAVHPHHDEPTPAPQPVVVVKV